jgi:hypothetical protein
MKNSMECARAGEGTVTDCFVAKTEQNCNMDAFHSVVGVAIHATLIAGMISLRILKK